jgi:hypothetical protein
MAGKACQAAAHLAIVKDVVVRQARKVEDLNGRRGDGYPPIFTVIPTGGCSVRRGG